MKFSSIKVIEVLRQSYLLWLGILLFCGFYIASYFVSVRRMHAPEEFIAGKSPEIVPHYVYFDEYPEYYEYAEIIFVPINAIDSILRPKYWNGEAGEFRYRVKDGKFQPYF